ncbi:MAG: hypothetical protein B6D37_14695 [Sphingobacteriales bacterium UTBCD1]|jgi:hypothetical protein|nr:MAG: hypothetical protein B6D37_14695 [Sphingobacteriales bacterium UTBCD1]
MILRLVLYAFLFYLLYKIVFELIIPVHKTSQQMKKGFQDMNRRMSEQMNKTEQNYAKTPRESAAPKADADDYLEFEEIK